MLGWGTFVTEVVSFLILAFIIFLMIKAANRVMTKKADGSPKEVDLLTEIRDLRKER